MYVSIVPGLIDIASILAQRIVKGVLQNGHDMKHMPLAKTRTFRYQVCHGEVLIRMRGYTYLCRSEHGINRTIYYHSFRIIILLLTHVAFH